MDTTHESVTCLEAAQLQTEHISVVIPAYNASAYLAATLQSVANQTSAPKEIIVVDDGSDDETVAIARSFDVRILSLANSGPSAARNAGIRAASGDYIALLDADDLWSPDKLAIQSAALRSHGGQAFSFTDYRIFDEAGIQEGSSGLWHHPAFRSVAARLTKSKELADFVIAADGSNPVLYDSYIQPSSVLVRRSDVFAIGGFDETLRVHEDHEFFLRLFAIRSAVAVMQSLMLYRRHPAQATADQISIKNGLFAVASRVSVAPERYPRADVQYLAKTEHIRHFRLGLEQARAERFEEAVSSFNRGLAIRFTLNGLLARAGARFCQSAAGRVAFHLLRTVAKWRSGRFSR